MKIIKCSTSARCSKLQKSLRFLPLTCSYISIIVRGSIYPWSNSFSSPKSHLRAVNFRSFFPGVFTGLDPNPFSEFKFMEFSWNSVVPWSSSKEGDFFGCFFSERLGDRNWSSRSSASILRRSVSFVCSSSWTWVSGEMASSWTDAWSVSKL